MHAAAAPLRSFDDSDLDDEISNELARYSNPELQRRQMERLELVWNVGKVTCLSLDSPVHSQRAWTPARLRRGHKMPCFSHSRAYLRVQHLSEILGS